ncbi:hypothetical protein AMECASPLE_038634 [Ameca splendens]|uniref:Uncharacterized protein n=1 Tax=Ameca splendens TaxID=208324 RepID=A0ABV0XXK9_9TELE
MCQEVTALLLFRTSPPLHRLYLKSFLTPCVVVSAGTSRPLRGLSALLDQGRVSSYKNYFAGRDIYAKS